MKFEWNKSTTSQRTIENEDGKTIKVSETDTRGHSFDLFELLIVVFLGIIAYESLMNHFQIFIPGYIWIALFVLIIILASSWIIALFFMLLTLRNEEK